MTRKFIWVVASSLVVVALLLGACAPAPAKETAPAAPAAPPAVKETAPPAKEAAPVVKETAPAVKEAVPAAKPGMIKVSLKKLDGTVVEKQVEKPQYGGTFIFSRSSTILAWDEAYQAPWTLGSSLDTTHQDLIVGDWARGAAGTGEVDWSHGEWANLGQAKGELAESWEFTDPETIIFHIRKGVHWGLDPNSAASRLVNGRELTADDVVFNLKRIYFDIPTSSMYGMVGVAKPTEVYAKDKYTVVLKAPAKYLGNALEEVGNLTKIFAPEIIKKYGDANAWENVVGTGPFFLKDYVPMSSATWTRNPNYWDTDPVLGPEYRLPYLDAIKVLIIPDRSTDLAALRTGRIDYSSSTYPKDDVLPLLKSRPQLQSYKLDPYICYTMGFRMDKPELPFRDIRVRRALLMAVNNQEILDTYYGGDGAVLTYKVSPTSTYIRAGWYTPLEQLPPEIKEIYTYNPVKAKQLLTEAGYPNGFKTEVVVRTTSPDMVDLALMVKEYWKKNLNVDLTVDIKDLTVATSLYQKKTFNQMLFWSRGGNVRSMYMCRKGNMYNWAMIDDPRADQYFDEISASYRDEAKRDKLVKEMNLYVLSQAWYYASPQPYYYFIWQPWLKNYQGERQLGVYSSLNWVPYVWLDQELKKSMER